MGDGDDGHYVQGWYPRTGQGCHESFDHVGCTDRAAGKAVIAELFIYAGHRRQGPAEELLHRCLHALHSTGRSTVAVSVDSSNAAALALYLSRDFRRLTDIDGEID